MRTYSNFLLFEDMLDNLPTGSPAILQTVNTLINPNVTIVEEDCGTLLGTTVATSYELEGLIELATGLPLTNTRLTTLLSQGNYDIRIRDTHSCISEKGVCRQCYQAHYLGSTAPAVGTVMALPAEFIYQTDVVIGDNINSTFTLSQNDTDYYSLQVFHAGSLVPSSNYTASGNTITFTSVPSLSYIYVVHFIKKNSEPLLGYISRSYTGALLGIGPLPTVNTTIRESLYDLQVSDGIIGRMVEELGAIEHIPSTQLDFINTIHSKLEKALYIAYLYAIYGSLQT